jgi:DNA polymerase-3 subunit alpha
VQRGLKVVLDKKVAQAKGTLGELKSLLKPGGKGAITISMALEERGREVEFALPGRFDISPGQQGAISTVPGVVEVVEV